MHIRIIIRTSCLAVLAHFSVLQSSAQTTPEFVNQGPNWTAATRADFYSRDQGSRMIPLAWLRALKQPNGQPFLTDSLGRYGYLPNPANSDQLPVGFTASGPTGSRTVGMTCAACHTRQITAEGNPTGSMAARGLSISRASPISTARWTGARSDAAFNSFANAVLNSTHPTPTMSWHFTKTLMLGTALPHADHACLADSGLGTGEA